MIGEKNTNLPILKPDCHCQILICHFKTQSAIAVYQSAVLKYLSAISKTGSTFLGKRATKNPYIVVTPKKDKTEELDYQRLGS